LIREVINSVKILVIGSCRRGSVETVHEKPKNQLRTVNATADSGNRETFRFHAIYMWNDSDPYAALHESVRISRRHGRNF
jgi:hypothetical protein